MTHSFKNAADSKKKREQCFSFTSPKQMKKKELTALLNVSETSLLPVREINLKAQKSKYERQ